MNLLSRYLIIFTTLSLTTAISVYGQVSLAYADADFEEIDSNLGEVYKLGSADKVLLFIPCASCRWRSFDEFMVRNSDKYTMYAITLPGYGGTENPDLPKWTGEPLWQNNALAALERLLEQEELNDVTVVGNSFGSTIALKLAIRKPDIISGLINLDGWFPNSLATEKRTPEERLAFARKVMLQYGLPYKNNPDAWQRFNGANIIARPDRRLLYHGWFMATDPDAMMQYWRENLLTDVNKEFRNLTIPLLDVQAIRPWDDTPEETRKNTVKRINEIGTPENYQMIFLYETPHFIMEERPDLLDQIIEDFMEGEKLHDFRPGSN